MYEALMSLRLWERQRISALGLEVFWLYGAKRTVMSVTEFELLWRYLVKT